MYSATNTLRLQDNEYVRGPGGLGGDPACAGVHGTPLVTFGSVTMLDGLARELDIAVCALASQPLALSAFGDALDSLTLRTSRRAAIQLSPIAFGPQLVPAPPAAQTSWLGQLPTAGSLQTFVTPRPIGGSRPFRMDFVQLVAVDAQGQRYLGEPSHIVVFDNNGAFDCNGNGVPDHLDIATGASLDLDGDGKPDECP